ncbi:LpqN/LpqT family lipoprotein [Mycobacterium sp. NPDC006124]|uniref:LpqN/LpqT family lipoprotein n=1 Tax=Mycobacterium sp. NPDC006124 TaxID=3156729 RepID=UPI0033A75DB4
MTLLRTAAVVVTALALAGCSTAGRDAAPSSTTSSSAASTTDTPAMTPAPPTAAAPTDRPQGFRDYLASINVTGAPVHLDQAPGLTVTVPVPEGWAQTSDPLFSTGVEFIQPVGQSGNGPSVTLMAVELTGPFDPKDAIRHANADALPPTATDVTESYDDYDGFPSAAAQGVTASTQHYNRIVLADVPSTGKRYLVQLTVTTPTDQLIAANPPLKSAVAGFKVAVS